MPSASSTRRSVSIAPGTTARRFLATAASTPAWQAARTASFAEAGELGEAHRAGARRLGLVVTVTRLGLDAVVIGERSVRVGRRLDVALDPPVRGPLGCQFVLRSLLFVSLFLGRREQLPRVGHGEIGTQVRFCLLDRGAVLGEVHALARHTGLDLALL